MIAHSQCGISQRHLLFRPAISRRASLSFVSFPSALNFYSYALADLFPYIAAHHARWSLPSLVPTRLLAHLQCPHWCMVR